MPEGSGEPADDGESDANAPSGSDEAAFGPDGAADRRGVHNLVRALDVPRQAKRGFAVGVVLAAATYWFFVVASGGSPYSTPYLLSLAGVLAFTGGLLATLVFTAVAAYRLSQRLT